MCGMYLVPMVAFCIELRQFLKNFYISWISLIVVVASSVLLFLSGELEVGLLMLWKTPFQGPALICLLREVIHQEKRVIVFMIAHVSSGICYSFFIIRMTTSLLSGIRRHIVVAKNTVMSFRLYAILSHQVLVYICWSHPMLNLSSIILGNTETSDGLSSSLRSC